MIKAAYLGPEGTYSQEAAFKAFGQDHEPYLCGSLAEVVKRVAANEVDVAVLPIENSTNGIVDLAVDALLGCPKLNNLSIESDVKIAVRHQLFTRADRFDQITTVYSHPQVWGQAGNWLSRNLPNARRIDCSSTAEAVTLALSSRDGSAAALGGPLSSQHAPLVTNCADDASNTTRFLVLKSAASSSRSGLSAERQERVWALAEGDFKEVYAQLQNVNPLFVAPRPGAKPWVYRFYIEFEKLSNASVPSSWRLLGSQ